MCDLVAPLLVIFDEGYYKYFGMNLWYFDFFFRSNNI
jgi:hypothetical protein